MIREALDLAWDGIRVDLGYTLPYYSIYSLLMVHNVNPYLGSFIRLEEDIPLSITRSLVILFRDGRL